MPRPDKVATVAELTEAFRSSSAAVLTEYRGLSVAQLKDLRRALDGQARYAVVKNTLTRLAARDAGLELLEPLLEGPSAIAFVTGDPVAVAKGIREFARANPVLVVKGGVLEGRALSADEVRRLAELESREVVLARLAGAVNASLTQAASLLQAPLAQAARLVEALRHKAEQDPSTLSRAAEQAAAPAAEPTQPAEPTEPTQPAEPTEPAQPTAAPQAVADATDVPPDPDVAGGATSAS